MHPFSIASLTSDCTSRRPPTGGSTPPIRETPTDQRSSLSPVAVLVSTPVQASQIIDQTTPPSSSTSSEGAGKVVRALEKHLSEAVSSSSASPPPTSSSSCPHGEKPPHSYIALITMAILASPHRQLLLADIYQYIMDRFPYYNNDERAWRNSVRHNLSLNACFIKCGRADNGKGHYWGIHPSCVEEFARGDFHRRHARRRSRRSIKDYQSVTAGPYGYRCGVDYVPMSHNVRNDLMPSGLVSPYMPSTNRGYYLPATYQRIAALSTPVTSASMMARMSSGYPHALSSSPSTPSLNPAFRFATTMHQQHPQQLLTMKPATISPTSSTTMPGPVSVNFSSVHQVRSPLHNHQRK